MKSKSSKLTKCELIQEIEKDFDIKLSKSTFEKYLYRHKIKCKDYNPTKAKNGKKVPIGYEYTKPDGMVLVKIKDPDVWNYKQRIIYENYYNIKLSDNDYIIFLNQDRTDFRIENLKRVTRRESAITSNLDMFSKNPELTELGINTAKLIIKANDVSKYVKRIDKAIEYINNLSNEPNVFGHYGIDGNCKKWLLNILRGEDNENKN